MTAFGKEQFRGCQKEVIEAALEGRHVIPEC
jgi:superfamily II DNA helicase RecQ